MAAACAGAYLFRTPVTRLPSFEQVRATYRQSEALLLDRHGTVIHELRVDYSGRKLDWVALGGVSPALVRTVIHSEDRRFRDHPGVDVYALSSAIVKNALFNEKRGASAITMQLAAALDDRLKPRGTKRSVCQKWQQLKGALALEKHWSKDQILEAYLNLVSFRGELRGVASAARGLLQKDASGLDDAESTLLAALIRSPNASPDVAAKRALVLDKSLGRGTGGDRITALAHEVLTRPYALKQRVALAPHVAHLLLREGSREARCSLDGDLQRFAAEALGANVGMLRDENVRDGALIAVDNRTGEILAYVGNTGAVGTLYVDGVRAKRQAGSTLKPFLYGLAFEQRLLDDASLLEDSSLHVPTGLGIYTPENYDRTHKGLVPARVALASSLNVPAVRVLMLVGTEPFVEKLSDLGIGPLQDGAYYGYSLALGSLDVSLWELVNAYRTIANGGIYGHLTFVLDPGKTRGKRVFSTEAAALVADILADREARGMTFGFENPLATRFWTASKTGTSKDMRDNWCIGFSSRYTVGVWVGNFSGEPMRNVSGVTGAAPVWLEVMNSLHRGLPSETPMRLRVARKAPGSRIEPGPVSARKDSYFVTVPSPGSLPGIDGAVTRERAPALLHTRITYPPKGTLIAMDPDIPYAHQRVFFEASQGTRLVWVLDGEPAGEGRVAGWSPRRGRHLLQLVDGDGSLLDEVRFRVTE